MREFWTETRHGLVLEGNPDIIHDIAGALNIPFDALVQVSSSRCVVGVWGEAVRKYQDLALTNGWWADQLEFASAG